MSARRAFTRAISPRLASCELTHLDRAPIDVDKAVAQHLAYERALAAAGLRVERLPPLEDAPDGVFVEDTAILLGDHAVITRPGAPSRALEIRSTAEALANRFTLHALPAGRLDGGDVMQIGRILYVGLSARTDPTGVEALRDIVGRLGYSVAPVAVRSCLHLKTAATYAGRAASGDAVLAANPAWVDPSAFRDVAVIVTDPTEPFAANTLRIGATLFHAAGQPRTRDRLAGRGLPVVSVDIAELQKAEAGLTCMSLIAEDGAAW